MIMFVMTNETAFVIPVMVLRFFWLKLSCNVIKVVFLYDFAIKVLAFRVARSGLYCV